MAGTIKDSNVMEGEFDRLILAEAQGVPRQGPWVAACLSSHTGPTWVFVDEQGNVVPLSSVLIAWKS